MNIFRYIQEIIAANGVDSAVESGENPAESSKYFGSFLSFKFLQKLTFFYFWNSSQVSKESTGKLSSFHPFGGKFSPASKSHPHLFRRTDRLKSLLFLGLFCSTFPLIFPSFSPHLTVQQ